MDKFAGVELEEEFVDSVFGELGLKDHVGADQNTGRGVTAGMQMGVSQGLRVER